MEKHSDALDHDPTNDILWGDCTEEIYLRRILAEREQGGDNDNDDGTLVDSLMGQSTVAEILASQNARTDDDDEEDPYDSRSWMRFAPIARSVATGEGTSSSFGSRADDELPQDEDVEHNNRPTKIPPDQDIDSFHNMMDERRAAFPGGVIPKYVDSDDDDESTIDFVQTPVADAQAGYDEEAAHTGDSQAGISTLTGDSLLRYGQMANIFEYEHPKWWMDLEDAKRRKNQERAQVRSFEPSKEANGIQLAITQSFSNSQLETPVTPPKGVGSKQEGCCSRFFLLITDNDKIFRRFVAVAVMVILVFLSLAILAVVEAGLMPFGDKASDGSTSAPTPAGETVNDIVGPVTTAPASSPVQVSPPTLQQQAADSATPPSTFEETSSTISDPYGLLVSLIREQSPESVRAVVDEESPQYRALKWLTDDLEGSSVISNTKIMERWTMAILYYGLDGDNWSNRQGWLSSDDICDWFFTATGATCNDQGLLQRLELQNNNLRGYLPEEIRLLAESLVVLDVSQNQLLGSVPESVGELTSLSAFRLEANGLTGSIPSVMCERQQLGELATISVDCSEVVCSCCDGC